MQQLAYLIKPVSLHINQFIKQVLNQSISHLDVGTTSPQPVQINMSPGLMHLQGEGVPTVHPPQAVQRLGVLRPRLLLQLYFLLQGGES